MSWTSRHHGYTATDILKGRHRESLSQELWPHEIQIPSSEHCSSDNFPLYFPFLHEASPPQVPFLVEWTFPRWNRKPFKIQFTQEVRVSRLKVFFWLDEDEFSHAIPPEGADSWSSGNTSASADGLAVSGQQQHFSFRGDSTIQTRGQG